LPTRERYGSCFRVSSCAMSSPSCDAALGPATRSTEHTSGLGGRSARRRQVAVGRPGTVRLQARRRARGRSWRANPSNGGS
jgi:hypothetical protein